MTCHNPIKCHMKYTSACAAVWIRKLVYFALAPLFSVRTNTLGKALRHLSTWARTLCTKRWQYQNDQTEIWRRMHSLIFSYLNHMELKPTPCPPRSWLQSKLFFHANVPSRYDQFLRIFAFSPRHCMLVLWGGFCLFSQEYEVLSHSVSEACHSIDSYGRSSSTWDHQTVPIQPFHFRPFDRRYG